MTRYKADYAGTGQLMRSDEMAAIMTEVGYRALDLARELSPVYRGTYKASWRMEVTSHGGPSGDRAAAEIVNDAEDRVLSDVVDGHDVPAKVLAALDAEAGL